MASVFNYNFDNRTRIGNDTCSITAREAQNNEMGSYNTTNYFLKECGMKKPIAFATQQPSMFYNGGFGPCGAGGCNITSDSKLKIGTIQTHPKCKISLWERPFKTVPYLGRGSSNPVLESHIQQGDMVTNKKSISTVSDQCFMGYSNYPLIPSIANSVTNPANLVEGVADEGWIRGGLPSRELQKDQDYLSHHTPQQY